MVMMPEVTLLWRPELGRVILSVLLSGLDGRSGVLPLGLLPMD
jgi:hypothetical protein